MTLDVEPAARVQAADKLRLSGCLRLELDVEVRLELLGCDEEVLVIDSVHEGTLLSALLVVGELRVQGDGLIKRRRQ